MGHNAEMPASSLTAILQDRRHLRDGVGYRLSISLKQDSTAWSEAVGWRRGSMVEEVLSNSCKWKKIWRFGGRCARHKKHWASCCFSPYRRLYLGEHVSLLLATRVSFSLSQTSSLSLLDSHLGIKPYTPRRLIWPTRIGPEINLLMTLVTYICFA